MSDTMRLSRISNRSARGYTLIVGLLLLLVLTLFAVGMFRSFGLQEKIAAATRDKQRALEAAQSALQYGEWWLAQGNGGNGVACSGVNNGNTLTNMRVCTTALSTPTTLPWHRVDLPAALHDGQRRRRHGWCQLAGGGHQLCRHPWPVHQLSRPEPERACTALPGHRLWLWR